jgi:hypothetical protein
VPNPDDGYGYSGWPMLYNNKLYLDYSNSNGKTQLGVLIDKVFTVRNGNWSDASVWNIGRLPVSGEQVSVYHVVQVNGSFSVGQLTIGNGGQLIYNQGNQLHIKP